MLKFLRGLAIASGLTVGLLSGIVIFCACEFFVAQAGLMGYKVLSQVFPSPGSFLVAFFFGSMIMFETDTFLQAICQVAFPRFYSKEGG